MVERGEIKVIMWVSTEKQLADVFRQGERRTDLVLCLRETTIRITRERNSL